jgi:hypothetical protein
MVAAGFKAFGSHAQAFLRLEPPKRPVRQPGHAGVSRSAEVGDSPACDMMLKRRRTLWKNRQEFF